MVSLPPPGNIYAGIPGSLPEELVEILVRSRSLRIERIVSKGHASAPGFWYDQTADEWVLLLKGAARIEFEQGRIVAMHPGDFLAIPAHARHRVAWTDPAEESVWLAIHHDGPMGEVTEK